jgi:hypothetical protein
MSVSIRRLVRERAGRRCEFCHIHEDDDPYTFHLEHITAKKHDGTDHPSNLAWSCQACNFAKGANLSGQVQGQVVTLFHPRRQKWSRHFRWRGPVLVGKTKCGRATIHVLNINVEERIRLRRLLLAAGQRLT